MKKLFSIVLFLTLLILTQIDVIGQQRSRSRQIRAQGKRISNYKGGVAGGFGNKKYTYLGISINAMNYFGDLAPKTAITSTDISFTRPGFGIHGETKIASRFSIGLGLLYGRLKGSDFQSADPSDDLARFRYVRNQSFRNDIFEFSARGVADITPNLATFLGRPTLNFYAFAGVAVLYHNPKGLVPETDINTGQTLAEAGTWVALRDLGTEGQNNATSEVASYGKIQIAIPVGLGIRYKFNQSFDINLEIGYRHMFFDYIDDVSGLYVDQSTLDSDLARVMADRSREIIDAESGTARDLTNPQIVELLSNRDSNNLIAGYGSFANGTNLRGNSNDNDIYMVTSIKLSYIIGSSIFAQAKYR